MFKGDWEGIGGGLGEGLGGVLGVGRGGDFRGDFKYDMEGVKLGSGKVQVRCGPGLLQFKAQI